VSNSPKFIWMWWATLLSLIPILTIGKKSPAKTLRWRRMPPPIASLPSGGASARDAHALRLARPVLIARAIERLESGAPVPVHLRGSIMALGNFDGFHCGHQAVVSRAI